MSFWKVKHLEVILDAFKFKSLCREDTKSPPYHAQKIAANKLSTIKESQEFGTIKEKPQQPKTVQPEVWQQFRHIVSGTGDNVYPFSIGQLALVKEDNQENMIDPGVDQNHNVDGIYDYGDVYNKIQDVKSIDKFNIPKTESPDLITNFMKQQRKQSDSLASPLVVDALPYKLSSNDPSSTLIELQTKMV